MRMKRCALAYAERLGWAVFPVAGDCRRPLIKGGCHAASSDAQQVARLFGREANIALATGRASGVMVLDVDVKGPADGLTTLAVLEDENGRLPPTWEAMTPTGGRHLYFALPAVRLRNRVGFEPGLDLRTDGGSVALPPSRRPDGRYRWIDRPGDLPLAQAPDWLVGLMTPHPAPFSQPRTPERRRFGRERTLRYLEAAVDGECGALAAMAANTGRNQRLFVASARLGQLVGARLLGRDQAEAALRRAAFDCGLIRDDGLPAVAATIASGLRRGIANPREIRP